MKNSDGNPHERSNYSTDCGYDSDDDEKITWSSFFVASAQVFALSTAFIMLVNDGKGL